MAQLMPLPLTVSCFSKIQIGFTFLVPAHPGREKGPLNGCVHMCVCNSVTHNQPVVIWAANVEIFFESLVDIKLPDLISPQAVISTGHSLVNFDIFKH